MSGSRAPSTVARGAPRSISAAGGRRTALVQGFQSTVGSSMTAAGMVWSTMRLITCWQGPLPGQPAGLGVLGLDLVAQVPVREEPLPLLEEPLPLRRRAGGGRRCCSRPRRGRRAPRPRRSRWFTSAGTRRAKRPASRASAHCRRVQPLPGPSRSSSVVSGKLSSDHEGDLPGEEVVDGVRAGVEGRRAAGRRAAWARGRAPPRATARASPPRRARRAAPAPPRAGSKSASSAGPAGANWVVQSASRAASSPSAARQAAATCRTPRSMRVRSASPWRCSSAFTARSAPGCGAGGAGRAAGAARVSSSAVVASMGGT